MDCHSLAKKSKVMGKDRRAIKQDFNPSRVKRRLHSLWIKGNMQIFYIKENQ